MKTFPLLFITLTTFNTAIEAKAQTMVAVVEKSPSSFEILYSAPEEKTVNVIIVDKYGNQLSTCTVRNTSNFKMPVVLANLHEGEYHVIIDNGGEVLKKALSFRQPAPIRAHVTKLTEDRYLVQISNDGTTQPVTISVYDGRSNLIQIISDNVAGQRAVLLKMQGVQGTPTFKVSDPLGLCQVIYN
ncbi:hypothetical protein [Chryseosolibacter indicus]|uniref:Uncharacterized protein n=1 Tax=Chryseosolibacter indicus TaxID=2782351 RepID=A0ABS5VWI1_9BACT|nr:hypothetical protein [Chryseosolibacter indicus]MBT1705782.1 hypothetical protein [Chryseosolibacter indicus]